MTANERITELHEQLLSLDAEITIQREVASRARLEIAELNSQAQAVERAASIAESRAEDLGRQLELAKSELAREKGRPCDPRV